MNVEMKRCPACMRRKQQTVCEYCGYDAGKTNLPSQLPAGTLLRGQYEIGRVLGQGGFGITYMGWDTALDMPVAIKEFYPNSLSSRNCTVSTKVEVPDGNREKVFHMNRERFLREGKILGMLGDIPGIVRVHNLFIENNTAYIVMEYVRGQDLRTYLQTRGKPLSVQEALTILRPVIQALGRVHATNLVHRDISPDNIMLMPGGGAKLLDFGAVSIVTDADAAKELNHSTMAILKKGFAPLEQYQTRGSLGPWTDVYAMCATLYYCVTGQVPPDAHDRMLENLPLNWAAIPGLNSRQAAALERGMAILPKERISSMAELEAELYGMAPVRTWSEPIPQVPSAPPVPTQKKSGVGKWIAVGVAAAVFAAVAAVGLLWNPVIKPASEYKKAESLMAEEKYEAAIEMFEDLGDYKDSEKQIQLCELAIQDREMMKQYNAAEELLEKGEAGRAAMAFAAMEDYKDARERCFAAWETATIRKTLSAGYYHTVGLKTDGTVLATGKNDNGRCDVSSWNDIVAIDANGYHTLGLRSNGTVLAAGGNDNGECDVYSWTEIVAIGAGGYHSAGLRYDGTVVATGKNDDGQCDVEDWEDVVAISTGNAHTVALLADGTVVATGANKYGQCNVEDWEDIVAISTGAIHTLGLKADGTVLAVGSNEEGRCNVNNWKNILTLSGGSWHTAAVKADGTVVCAGSGSSGRLDVGGWEDIVCVGAGFKQTVGLKSDGTVVAAGSNEEGQCNVKSWRNIKLPHLFR